MRSISILIISKVWRLRRSKSTRLGGALFLLSTNDKTIKYWKVQEKNVKKISEMNVDPSKAAGNDSISSSSVCTKQNLDVTLVCSSFRDQFIFCIFVCNSELHMNANTFCIFVDDANCRNLLIMLIV